MGTEGPLDGTGGLAWGGGGANVAGATESALRASLQKRFQRTPLLH